MVAFYVPIGLMGAAPPLILTFTDSGSSTSGTSVSGLNFGAANVVRYLIAAIGCASPTALSSVTIGGVAATHLVDTISPFGSVRTAFYIALVPTGTSGTVSASAGAVANFAVALYSAVNLLSTAAFDTATASGLSPLNMSVGVQARGVVLATAYSIGSSTLATWTGLTTVDANFDFSHLSFDGKFSAGQYTATAATTRSLSVSMTTSNAFSACAVSLL